jgi:hypothetical protein
MTWSYLEKVFYSFMLLYSHLPWSRAVAPRHIYRMSYAERMPRTVPRWYWKAIYHFLLYNRKLFTTRICRSVVVRCSTWRTYLAPFLPLLSLLLGTPSSKLILGGRLYLLLLTSRLSVNENYTCKVCANAKIKVSLNKFTCNFILYSMFSKFK